MANDFRIEGLQQAVKKLNKLDRAFGADGLNAERELLEISKVVKGNVQSESPVVTGNLRKHVIAYKSKYQKKNKPAALVESKAHHAHLVERGHITASGSHTAANPYFRRGVERSRMYVMARLKKMLQTRIERAAKR